MKSANEELKKLLKSKELSEDREKVFEKNVQNITDKHIAIVDEKFQLKKRNNDNMNPLKHVAIIMDGNGRWGLRNRNSRNAGHKAGLNTVERIIKETIRNNIKFLTLYAFSTENWKGLKKRLIFYLIYWKIFLKKKLKISINKKLN